MINFGTATLNRIIMHQVHKKVPDQEHSDVTLENYLFDTDEDVQKIIKKRLINSCGNRGKSFQLEIANVAQDSFFSFASNIWEGENEEFITKSKSIAHLLGAAQRSGKSSEGFLIVSDGRTADDTRFMFVVKAEFQEALTTKLDETTNLKKMELLNNIFLTPAKKFFKIGILWEDNKPEETFPNSNFSCMIFDDQFSPDRGPANFFFDKFLGFSINRNAKFLCKKFFDDVSTFIIDQANDEDKQDLLDAVKLIYSLDNAEVVDPYGFGEQYVPEYLKQSYTQAILANPMFNRPFPKNFALMGRRLKWKTIYFKNKQVTLKAPEENFDQFVSQIENIDEAREVLERGHSSLFEIKGRPYGR
ncbi:MAG: hypothetical protein DHS20C18_44070 [Saprospiraceae bacterium]|nr:MAG: hypothetical protein DHS20C18_44070 [Saprospiraceae bacterium]